MAKLLVVDDNAGDADDLADVLRHHGHAVRTAYSTKQCLSLVDDFRPDAALLFLGGADLVRRIGKKAAVIGPGQLKKPVKLRELLLAVSHAVAERQ